MILKRTIGAIVVGTSLFGGGVAYGATKSTSYAPAPHKSWAGQNKAEVACAAELDDVSWESCLVKGWEKYTGKHLSSSEYVTNGAKGTWSVSWSHVVLPSGGKVMNKAAKAVYNVPVTVYCKAYNEGEGKVVLCNNGYRHE